MIRPKFILRSPIRSAAFIKHEADWLRHFAATMEHRGMPALPPATNHATDRLHEQLDAADLATIEAQLSGDEARAWAAAEVADRRRLALAFGLRHGVPGVAEKTGLSAVAPPESVHAMARGSIATGGSYYYADIVADGLSSAGASLVGGRVLDFGCSSGRVVRVLHAAYPDVEWYGCDPQAPPIEWAGEHLPGIEFCVSPQRPPLPYGDGDFDAVFAISIWSHYGESAARVWLEEMHRLIRPGGHLLLTFHGPAAIAYYVARNGRSRRESIKIVADVYRDGFWFAQQWETPEEGDHGVRNTEWGTAFFTTEWLLSTALPEWSVTAYGCGRAEGNQDLVVLQRR
jgi:SAM-dependent methyltransferase